MSKRFSPREFALLCAPILFIGLALLVPRLLHPPKDPNAVIALMVREIPSTLTSSNKDNDLHFAWRTDATNSPRYGYDLGYREQIVAITKTGEQIIYSDPPVAGSANASISSGSGSTPGQSWMMMRSLQISSENIPVTARRLEWRGEIVAAPLTSGSTSGATNAATLVQRAKIKGAARVQKVIPIRFDVAKIAIRECRLEPVNAENAAAGFDTCITTKTAAQPNRICRRLVAFDGKKQRVLWQEEDHSNSLPYSERISQFGDISNSNLLFRLRDVPREWGEISFLLDVVSIGGSVTGIEGHVDLKTLAKLEGAGGARFSRRLTVRATS